ncbi:MAG: flagellar biosynthesis protein FlhB [Magnetococcales bacterium]|nr:flagellar biosynthesis protein FlhB [Magnetococcales bacterium]
MAEDSDKDSKTEEPTPKRLEESRKKGQVATSREVSTAFLFLGTVLLFFFQGQALWQSLQNKMRFLLSGQITDDLTREGVELLFEELVIEVMKDLLPFFMTLMVLAILAALVQHGFMVSWEAVAPKFSKVNPLSGLKRLFSMRSLVEMIKSVIKMTIIGVVVWWAIEDSAMQALVLTDTTIMEIVSMLGNDSMKVIWNVTMAFVLIAILDFLYQKWEYIKGLRMTKQEVKDEMKQMEGDPLLKGRIRQIQREMAQRRMMQEVPEADVVITNPTHFSIAIKYTPGEMSAPKVTAKGRGPVAGRIRERAKESGVPLVENPPLARVLYRDVELDQSVPPDLFKAVAEVLAYVYNLKGRQPAA